MKTKNLHIRISEGLYQKFIEATDEKAVNRSELVRRWIENYVKEETRMLKVTHYLEQELDFPKRDESYVVGQAEDGRYFFAWGSKWPKDDLVPAEGMEDGENGISWHSTEEAALDEMKAARN